MFYMFVRKFIPPDTKCFCEVNTFKRKASRSLPLLITTILEMGFLSISALATPFVFSQGVQPFIPMGRIIASLAYSPSTPHYCSILP